MESSRTELLCARQTLYYLKTEMSEIKIFSDYDLMRQVPLEREINIAVDGPFLLRNLHQEWPFMAVLIPRSILEELASLEI